jgi:hypothetical protein
MGSIYDSWQLMGRAVANIVPRNAPYTGQQNNRDSYGPPSSEKKDGRFSIGRMQDVNPDCPFNSQSRKSTFQPSFVKRLNLIMIPNQLNFNLK